MTIRDPFSNYDQWKTASPYDEDPPDDICAHCFDKLPPDPVEGTCYFDGFCCSECQKAEERGDYPPFLRIAGEQSISVVIPMGLYKLLSHDLGNDPNRWSKAIYKGTDCGAWLNILDSGLVEIGSIVEGVDFDCETQELQWPFTRTQFWDSVQAVEDEAKSIWELTHGCEDCNAGESEYGMPQINPNCKTCDGFGIVI